MASTKIINVSKSDSFEDIFEVFKNTAGDEIILIFPRGSKLAKASDYLESLKTEADASGKKISILTTDPIIAGYAEDIAIPLLSPVVSKPRISSALFTDKGSASYANDDEMVASPEEIDENEPISGEDIGGDIYEKSSVSEHNEDSDDPDNEFVDEKSADDAAEDNAEPLARSLKFMDPLLREGDDPEVILAAARKTYARSRSMDDIMHQKPGKNIRIRSEDQEEEIEIEPENNDLAKVWSRGVRGSDLSLINIRKKRKHFFSKKTSAFLALGALIVLLLILYSTLASANIVIKPKKQPLNVQQKITASTEIGSINAEFNKIPGQLIKVEKEESGSFPLTGQKNVVQKAGGKIVINNKSATAQNLVATTRFESTDGLIFRIPQTVTVPASSRKGSGIVPGTLEVTVYADRPGPEYNIVAGKFSIPGFKGNPKFEQFYGESETAMTGGYIGPAQVVTESDFTKAKENLTNKLRDKITNSLKDQADELKILDLKIDFADPVTNARVGEAPTNPEGKADNLQMSIRGSAKIIGFREGDVIGLIKKYVSQNNQIEAVETRLNLSYRDVSLAGSDKNMSFNVLATGEAVAKINQDKILEDILGFDEPSIRLYFKDLDEVESVRVTLSPFWVKSIPKDISKVKLNIIVD